MTDTYKMLVSIMREKLGYIILDDYQSDISFIDYMTDSLTFVSFIIYIEEEIGVELTDDFLDPELMRSGKGFAEKLDSYLETIFFYSDGQ